MIIDEVVYLEHFGVKGMHWGIRKKSDGPKGTHKQAVLDKRKLSAKKYEEQAKAYDAQIKKRLATPVKNRFQKKAVVKDVNSLKEKRNTALINAKAKNEGKRFTPDQKKVVKGVAITAGILAAYGSYKLAQSGQAHGYIMKGRQIVNHMDTPFLRKESLSRKDVNEKFLKDEVMKPMISNRGSFGNNMNCRRCTFAYEMRRRGYDVAPTRTTNASGQNAGGILNATRPGQSYPTGAKGILKNTITKKKPELNELLTNSPRGLARKMIEGDGTGADSVFNELSKLPKGARGELGMIWNAGGGHSMSFENLGGKTIIIDNQSGKMYKKGSKDFAELFANMNHVGYTRLDDLELNPDFLVRWLKDG